MPIECPGTKDEGTFLYYGLGFGATKGAAHQMAKSQCDGQAKAAADQFASLEQCGEPTFAKARTCEPKGSYSIVKATEYGPAELGAGFWVCGLMIEYRIIVTCERIAKKKKKFF